jgi:hypothetical protein
VADLKPPKILEGLKAIEDRGSIETARRVRQRISAVFVYAIAKGVAGLDPRASANERKCDRLSVNSAGYHSHHVPHGFRAAFSTIMNGWAERMERPMIARSSISCSPTCRRKR